MDWQTGDVRGSPVVMEPLSSSGRHASYFRVTCFIAFPLEVLWAHPSGRTQARPNWRDFVSHLAREYLGIPQEELEVVAGEGYVWATPLNLLPS